MKADMTQVSVYRGSRVRAERKSGIGTGSKVQFFSFLVKYYHDQRDKSYRVLRYLR